MNVGLLCIYREGIELRRESWSGAGTAERARRWLVVIDLNW